MHRTALLVLDLSPAAEPLLECAAELRRWGVGHLVITHVDRMGYGQDPGDRALQEIREWLEGRATRLRGPALNVEVTVRAAPSPADGIIAMGNEAKADLIVLGSRSHNLASRLFLGSVARHGAQDTGAMAAGMAGTRHPWRGDRLCGSLRRYPASCPADHRPVEACRCSGRRRRCVGSECAARR